MLRKELPKDADKFTYHPKPIKEAPYYLILSKALPENKKRIEKFNKGLKKLTDSGRKAQMIKDSNEGKYSL
jgi:polar amino acid transport system substrate-binding protein